MLSADETQTVYATLFDEGWPDVPHRVLRNETTKTWERAGRPTTDRPGEGDMVAETMDGQPVERYEDSLATPEMTGNVEELPLYAGQSVGSASETRSAHELVSSLTQETVDTLESSHSLCR